jgi:ComF family protein
MRVIPHPRCPLCGQHYLGGNRCPTCRRYPLAIDGIVSAYIYEGAIRQAILRLKYHRIWALTDVLGRLLAENTRAYLVPCDVVIPVPLHIRRRRERGFNQAELLARPIAATVAAPLVPGLLIRNRPTASQTALTARERFENVRHAFTCVQPEAVRGRSVLLVDDVCTTGATLQAAAAALYSAGAVAVHGVTLARESFVERRQEDAR